jgi:uncharacterized membrane protein
MTPPPADAPRPTRPVPVPLEQTIRAVMERRERETRAAPPTLRVAAAVTNFLGSLWSVVVHAAVYGGWILVNLGLLSGLLPVAPWDPTFVMLGMIASVEALFLTTFVLINQNRLAAVEEERSELALQMALLSERRTSTMLAIVARLAELRQPAKVDMYRGVEQAGEEPRRRSDLARLRVGCRKSYLGGQIALGVAVEGQQVGRKAVVDHSEPVDRRRRKALRIGDRAWAASSNNRWRSGRSESAMQGRQRRSPDFPQQREVQEVNMEMHVERRRPFPDLLSRTR